MLNNKTSFKIPKGVTRISNSKMDRQYNGQKKKDNKMVEQTKIEPNEPL